MGLFNFLKRDKDEYNTIYDDSSEYSDNSEVYEDVYDEDGYFVYCDLCNAELKWKDGNYICPECGQILNRSEFMNYIGAEPPGPECVTCDNQYPGCIVCPYGYINDNEY